MSRIRRKSVPSTPVLGVAARKALDRRGKSEDKEEREVCEIFKGSDDALLSRLTTNTNKLYLWCTQNDVSVSRKWKTYAYLFNSLFFIYVKMLKK